MKKHLLCGLVLSLCFLFGTGTALARDGKVTLYSINHLQSRLLPAQITAKQPSPSVGGLSWAASVVKADMQKSANPIFVTTGEVVAGTMWRYFKGKPEMAALSKAGVAVNMLGKHEFDYGLDHLKEALSQTDIPIVISNLVTQDPDLKKSLQKNLVLQAGDMKVGFFGLLSPGIMRLTNRPKEVSLDPDLNTIAREMVADLRRKGADVIVLLSGLYDNESTALARSVAGIHVITGSGAPVEETDKPIFIDDPEGGTTVLIWSGVWAKFVGRLGLSLKDGKLDRQDTFWKLLPVSNRTAPDPGVLAVAVEYDQKLNQALKRVVGHFERSIDARNKILRSGEAPIGNFITDSFRWKTGADVALINSGGIRGNVIYPAGEFSERNLSDLLPFGDRLFVLTLTGKELRWALELSASALIREEGDDYDPLERLHTGSFLQISGLKVVYDLSAPPTVVREHRVVALGRRLKSLAVLRDGEWREIGDEDTCTVATTNWMVNGGSGEQYEVLRNAPRTEAGCFDFDAFAEYLTVVHGGRARLQTEGRVSLVNGRAKAKE